MRIGKHLTLKEFCECTETFKIFASTMNPYPEQDASIQALSELAENILDPIIDHYGRSKFILTYGFCSNDLRRKLTSTNPTTGHAYGRVAPGLDQHLAAEVKRGGNPVCGRGGAAVDFRIEGENSRSVVKWVIEHRLPFDRLYFYGADRSIHISHGPEHSRYICGFSGEKKVPSQRTVRDLVDLARKVFQS